MYLNGELAKMIVKRLEQVQPYKVVVINDQGIIMGASDPGRIGLYHAGAVKRMQHDRESGESGPRNMLIGETQMGQGACIHVNGDIVGVIGLSGAFEQINLFLGAAETIVELMLEREVLSKELRVQNAFHKNLLVSLLSDGEHDIEDLRWKLDYYRIDIHLPRTVVLMDFSRPVPAGAGPADPLAQQSAVNELFGITPRFFSHAGDLILYNELKGTVVVLCANRSKNPAANTERIRQICLALADVAADEFHLDGYTVIGEQCRCLSDYFGQYRKMQDMLRAGLLLYPGNKCYLGESMVLGNFVTALGEQARASIEEAVMGDLLRNKLCDSYLTTLEAMFRFNMNIHDIARHLYIHRNTLQYRFRRIGELTGYSPYDLDGMVTLRIAYLCYRQRRSRR